MPRCLPCFQGSSIQTMFLTTDDEVFHQAEELAREAKSSKQYTDVNGFSLKCLQCQELMQGQIQAQQHAKITGHKNFGEIA